VKARAVFCNAGGNGKCAILGRMNARGFFYALWAFIYKARRASKKVGAFFVKKR
jgi:hypothetical protein